MRRGSLQQRRPDRQLRGFTLIELLLALAVASVVLTAVPVVISISARAAPSDSGVQSAASEASDLFAQLDADLRLAQAVTSLSATSITMVVPDRAGAGVTQTVIYDWGGNPGDPVTVQIDAGSPMVVVASATSFTLSGTVGARSVHAPVTLTSTSGVDIQDARSAPLQQVEIPPKGALVQVIEPSLAAETAGWRISSLEILLSTAAPIAGESVVLEIRSLNPDQSPTGTVHYRKQIASTDLGAAAGAWTVRVPKFWLPTNEPVGLVLSVTSASLVVHTQASPHDISYTGGPLFSAAEWVGPWTAVAGYTLTHRIRGGLLTSVGGATPRDTLARLDVSLTTGDGPWQYATSIVPLSPVAKP